MKKTMEGLKGLDRRHHKKEVKKILSQLQDQSANAAIMEIFDDLHERRNYYRDALGSLRIKHKKLKDESSGITRDLKYSLVYVRSKMHIHDKCTLYFDKGAGRFSVRTVHAPTTDGYELVGVYEKPYNSEAIKEDMKHVLDEYEKENAGA